MMMAYTHSTRDLIEIFYVTLAMVLFATFIMWFFIDISLVHVWEVSRAIGLAVLAMGVMALVWTSYEKGRMVSVDG